MTPPLKRHPALQPLSREHMNGLIQARNLQQAAAGMEAAGGRERALAAVRGFAAAWRGEIRGHFDDEERLLLPLTSSAEMRERLVSEHRVLRELAGRCEGEPEAVAADAELMRRIGRLLHDHIRWEERVYFEAVQREHPGALAMLEHEAAEIEERRPGARTRQRLARDGLTSCATCEGGPMEAGKSDRQRQPPAERFAAEVLSFDLGAEIAALRAEAVPARHGHRQKTLYKHGGRTVALFVLDEGGGLPEHSAQGTVTVQALEGRLAMTIAGRERTLEPGGMVVMAPGVRHDVRALAAAAFLLQVSLAAGEGG